MKLKQKKQAKRCAYCTSLSVYRGGGGECRIDGTKIPIPELSVCDEGKFKSVK